MNIDLIQKMIDQELVRAATKFPSWPTDPFHAAAIIGEEVGELNQALLKRYYEGQQGTYIEIRDEAIQVAVTAIRFLRSLDEYVIDGCFQHEQPAPEER